MANKQSTSNNGKDSRFFKLFQEQLKDIYWAEKNLVPALEKMKKAATSSKLASAIEKHAKETQGQIERLEQVFSQIEMAARAKKCEAMEGLIEEGNEIVSDTKADTMVRDAGIIIASQKIEHYEIASYGSLIALANKMAMKEVVKLLEKTLEEEKKTDALLSDLAEKEINEEALKE
ncbi:YciE/YciF ferroxidase family protein [Litoribacter populi]|uniref:YciE/YciF ferroxidase family protein n=1 Tax=Litoribacter populi TaxID=2598460 RepID=UPI001180D0A2|nr:ferritin-like domain-containing protein [Litoribacter populi]